LEQPGRGTTSGERKWWGGVADAYCQNFRVNRKAAEPFKRIGRGVGVTPPGVRLTIGAGWPKQDTGERVLRKNNTTIHKTATETKKRSTKRAKAAKFKVKWCAVFKKQGWGNQGEMGDGARMCNKTLRTCQKEKAKHKKRKEGGRLITVYDAGRPHLRRWRGGERGKKGESGANHQRHTEKKKNRGGKLEDIEKNKTGVPGGGVQRCHDQFLTTVTQQRGKG